MLMVLEYHHLVARGTLYHVKPYIRVIRECLNNLTASVVVLYARQLYDVTTSCTTKSHEVQHEPFVV